MPSKLLTSSASVPASAAAGGRASPWRSGMSTNIMPFMMPFALARRILSLLWTMAYLRAGGSSSCPA
eukprot:1611158-Heterocapsa_arctica.AAC.1